MIPRLSFRLWSIMADLGADGRKMLADYRAMRDAERRLAVAKVNVMIAQSRPVPVTPVDTPPLLVHLQPVQPFIGGRAIPRDILWSAVNDIDDWKG